MGQYCQLVQKAQSYQLVQKTQGSQFVLYRHLDQVDLVSLANRFLQGDLEDQLVQEDQSHQQYHLTQMLHLVPTVQVDLGILENQELQLVQANLKGLQDPEALNLQLVRVDLTVQEIQEILAGLDFQVILKVQVILQVQ